MLSVKSISFYVLLALFIATVSAGIVLLISQRSGNPGVEITLPTATPTLTATPSPEIKVFIGGAVASPGVYAMKEGDRLEDAIAAAGGVNESLLPSCFNLDMINLAIRVKDEDYLYIPRTGDLPMLEELCQAIFIRGATSEEDTMIDLNTATVEQLETLPGIGKVKAQAIVDYRKKNGPFKSTEEVMEVRGIGPATYESIRDLIYVSGSSP